MFEIFYYKANTCANNLALSLIVFCPLLHCRHSCQFTYSYVCRVHCLCYVCTLILYIGLLYCTVVQKFLSDRSEHRIHPGDTTTHTHRQSQMLSSGSLTKKSINTFRIWKNILLKREKRWEMADNYWANFEVLVQAENCLFWFILWPADSNPSPPIC